METKTIAVKMGLINIKIIKLKEKIKCIIIDDTHNQEQILKLY